VNSRFPDAWLLQYDFSGLPELTATDPKGYHYNFKCSGVATSHSGCAPPAVVRAEVVCAVASVHMIIARPAKRIVGIRMRIIPSDPVIMRSSP
jgi:hypothetical protein